MPRRNLSVEVKREWCKGCNICVSFCPKNVLELDEEEKIVVARREDCIKCFQCEMRCPDFAIFLIEKEEEDE